MKSGGVFFLLLLCLLLPFLPVVSLVSLTDYNTKTEPILPSQGDIRFSGLKGDNPVQPGPDLGIVNWTANRVQNPGFEQWVTSANPNDWTASSTMDRYRWIATQPTWPVNQGTYSAGIECRGALDDSYATLYQEFAADMRNLSITFDWYLGQNMFPATDYFRFEVNLIEGSTIYTLNYYLNGTRGTLTNQTFFANFQVGGLSQQWNTFSRNLTADYLAVPTFPGTIGPTLECYRVRFRINAIANIAPEFLRVFVDDVYLTNESTTWIGGSTANGDFETGSFSSSTGTSHSDAGYISQSPTSHTGNWSANATILSRGNYSQASLWSYPELRITSFSQSNFQFWWNLDYHQSIGVSISYLILGFHNRTHEMQIYYFIGYTAGFLPWPNTSTSLTFHADNFNTTGSWVYCNRNLWLDAAAYFSTDELFISYFAFMTYTNSAGHHLTVLIDDFTLIGPALNGAGFEDQPAIGDPVRGWTSQNWSGFTVTGTAYAGIKAANLTLANDADQFIYQYLTGRPLNGTRESYLDLMWRLEDYTQAIGNRAYLEVRLESGHRLFYYFAIVPADLPLNTSSSAYFTVAGINTMNTWMQMHRDLVHDFAAVFGSLPNTRINVIILNGYTSPSNRLELLMDDLYLYDDPAPRISNINQNIAIPQHNNDVQITADIEDQDLNIPQLHYRLNGGIWQNLSMLFQSGITFKAMIPGQIYSTVVDYYVTANDTWGLTTIGLNGTNYYSYTVDDLVDPTLSITQPADSEEVSGTIAIEVTANDLASGVASVEFFVDTSSLFNDQSAPYSYSWDTTTVSDGSHTITATASDVAGNSASDSVTIIVNNTGAPTTPTPPPPPPLIPGFPFEAIGIALIVALVAGIVRRRRRHNKC